jgi:serine/threonine protein kinase
MMPSQPNVLVDDDCVAKVCDFGLLRLFRESAPTGMTTGSSHNGTPRYLSYELVSANNEDDPKPTTESDIYALACIGMQVGTHPFNILTS